jgi:chemotaxis protein CheD
MTRPSAADRVVGLGQFVVLQGSGTAASYGLGSCVAVLMHDADAKVGGLAHVVLPSAQLSRERNNPARFAETAVPVLVSEMLRAGAVRGRLRARLVGGASMFAALTPAGSVQMGQRNLNACRTALQKAGVPVVTEAVGGEIGRSLWFDVATGTVTVRSVGREPEVL